jgi:hypothetical protein
MPWDNIPFMIGGQVQHSAELARLAVFTGAGGREGIVRPADLAVVPLATPGGGIRVAPGAMVAINRSPGADSEAYCARLDSYDTVTIAATTDAARDDLIIARIEDPYQSGNTWPVPASASKNTAIYVRTAVIPGVTGDPRTLAQAAADYSAIPLARVELPANTSTVQATHIVDLRSMYAPLTRPEPPALLRPSAADAVTGSMAGWPDVLSMSVWIPPWATHADVRVSIADALASGATTGTLGVVIGAQSAASTPYDVEGARRASLGTAARVYIPPGLRGTTQTLSAQAQKTGGAGDLSVDTRSQVMVSLAWTEAPV